MPAGSAARSADTRPGATLVELLVVVTLVTLLASALFGLLIVQLRVTAAVGERAHAGEAIRVASAVLQGEAQRMMAADVRAAAAESLAVRAFRGAGVPCAHAATTLHVRYRGDRLPEPGKDSALAVMAVPGSTAVELLDARTAEHAGCAAGPGERILQLRLAQAVDSAAVVLIFESGSYYVSSRALRYRLGAEGRQPLTAELLLAGSRFEPAAADRIRLRLVTRAAGDADLPVWFGAGSRP